MDLAGVDLDQAHKLEEYLRKVSTNGLLVDYTDDAQLAAHVSELLRTAVAHDEGITVDELEETRIADVWPSTEVEHRPSEKRQHLPT